MKTKLLVLVLFVLTATGIVSASCPGASTCSVHNIPGHLTGQSQKRGIVTYVQFTDGFDSWWVRCD
jgi:hypothetical protein